MRNYCLLGQNISKSLSPKIHNFYYQSHQIKAMYFLYDGGIDKLISQVKKGVVSGFNVTAPYKKEIIKYLDEMDDAAARIGAVNTVITTCGKLKGYNTDYDGFIAMLHKYQIDVQNKDVYIIGDGGAALAVNIALQDLKACPHFISRKADNFEDLLDKDLYLIVNATPVDNPVEEKILERTKYLIDLKYTGELSFLKNHLNAYNGLYMLAAQAAKSLEIWFDEKVDIDSLYQIIKEG